MAAIVLFASLAQPWVADTPSILNGVVLCSVLRGPINDTLIDNGAHSVSPWDTALADTFGVWPHRIFSRRVNETSMFEPSVRNLFDVFYTPCSDSTRGAIRRALRDPNKWVIETVILDSPGWRPSAEALCPKTLKPSLCFGDAILRPGCFVRLQPPVSHIVGKSVLNITASHHDCVDFEGGFGSQTYNFFDRFFAYWDAWLFEKIDVGSGGLYLHEMREFRNGIVVCILGCVYFVFLNLWLRPFHVLCRRGRKLKRSIVQQVRDALDEAVARPFELCEEATFQNFLAARYAARVLFAIGLVECLYLFPIGPFVIYASKDLAFHVKEARPHQLMLQRTRLRVLGAFVFLNSFPPAVLTVYMSSRWSGEESVQENERIPTQNFFVAFTLGAWIIPSLLQLTTKTWQACSLFNSFMINMLLLPVSLVLTMDQLGGTPVPAIDRLLYGTALGLKWRNIGTTLPGNCKELVNEALAQALKTQHVFTKEEFDQFRVRDLRRHHYIKLGSSYFVPAGTRSRVRILHVVYLFAVLLVSTITALTVIEPEVHPMASMSIALPAISCVVGLLVAFKIFGDGGGGLMGACQQERRERAVGAGAGASGGGAAAAADSTNTPSANHGGASRFVADAQDLLLGEPREAALGLCHVMRVDEAEVRARMVDGASAIVREIEAHGTEEDQRMLRQIVDQPDIPMPDGVENDGCRPLQYYYQHEHARAAGLGEGHVLALRLYTTPAFRSLNAPLRGMLRDHDDGEEHDGEETTITPLRAPPPPHPFPCTLLFISDGIKKLRAIEEAANPSTSPMPPTSSNNPTPATSSTRFSLSSTRTRVGVSDGYAVPLLLSAAGALDAAGGRVAEAAAHLELMRAPTADRELQQRSGLVYRNLKRILAVAMRLLAWLRETVSPYDREAEDPNTLVCWRGMRNLRASEKFMADGGSELAPMSSTSELTVAVRYALSDVADSGGGGGGGESSRMRSNKSLLFRIRTRNFMQRGANLAFLSQFPTEKEYLYPPMTLIKPYGEAHEMVFDGVLFSVVDVEPHFPT